jgi:UDP:flavonoid glycosyltransferase YjiC (YdhE family)
MRITILALGTRGDVQPAVALALGLRRAGHSVRVAAPPLSQDVVTGHGLDYAPLGDPPKARGSGRQISVAGIIAFVSRTAFLFVRSLFSRGPGPTWPAKTPDLERLMDCSWAACEGADAIISPFITVWVYHIAEKMGVPCYLWDTHPLTPTRAFPDFQFTGIFPAWFRIANVLPSWFRRDGGFNLWTHRAVQRLLLNLGLRLTNSWRAQKLQLPMLRNIQPLVKFYNDGATVLYSYSPLIVPKPDDWPAFHHVTGYWFLDRTDEWQPPSELLRFLAAGPPPVCVGFGSARDRNPQRLTKIMIEALARAKCRGILLTGRGGLSRPVDVPPTIFIIDFVPHDWLFPRVAAVVHHCGAGTCGAVLRAGIPSIAVPWWGDMYFWADCLHRLGVSPPFIAKGSLSAERLAEATRMAVNDASLREQAASIGRQIASEEGVERAVQIISRAIRG